MKVNRVITAYLVSPFAAGIYWVFLNWQINGRDPEMWRDLVGILSILGLFAVIGYVAEGLLGIPLLYWFRRHGYLSLPLFLIGGILVGIVVGLFVIALYQLFREMSLMFNLMFVLVGCIVPALLSTIVFWFIGGRHITKPERS